MTIDTSKTATLRTYGGLRAHPAAEMMPLLGADELRTLTADIKANGLRIPIILLGGQILDGRNRASACEAAGVPLRTEPAPPGINPWRYVWSLNAERRHLEPSQRVMIVREMLAGSDAYEEERRKAAEEANKARSAAMQGVRNAAKDKPENKSFVPGQTTISRPSPPASRPSITDDPEDEEDEPAPIPSRPSRAVTPARSADTSRHEHVRLSEAAGVSPSTAARALAVAKKAPELVEKIKAGELTVKEADAVIKRQAKEELAAKLDSAPPAPPQGPFDVIVSDPPWCYTKRADDITHRSRLDYPDMTQEQILALPVPKLAGPDCILWLWTTNAFMHDALHCIEAWGFTQKTILTWAKDRMGTGDWLRGQTEHCVLAVKGKPLVTLTNQTTVLNAPLREHSRKPDEFFALVNKLCHGRKLEMFSREKREGWIAWGGELEKFKG